MTNSDNEPANTPVATGPAVPGETASPRPQTLEIPKQKVEEFQETAKQGAREDIAKMQEATGDHTDLDEVTDDNGKTVTYEYTEIKGEDTYTYTMDVSRTQESDGNKVTVYTSTVKGAERTGTNVVMVNHDQDASTTDILNSQDTEVQEIGRSNQNHDGVAIRSESTLVMINGYNVRVVNGQGRDGEQTAMKEVTDPAEAGFMMENVNSHRITPNQ